MSKPKIQWYQYFGVGAFVAGWVAQTFMDNKVTKMEVQMLIDGICGMLGIDEIEIKD